MKGLASFCYRKRRYVIVAWILLLVGLSAISAAFAGQFRTEFELPDSESARALDLMQERGATLVRQLLAFTRRDAVQPKPIDLATMLSALSPLMQRLIGEPVKRSMSRIMRRSRGVTKSVAMPARPARPVRPMRCTYTSTSFGMS